MECVLVALFVAAIVGAEIFASKEARTGCAAVIGSIVLVIGGGYYWFFYKPAAQLEADLRACAETNVPELQQLIDGLETERANLEKRAEKLKAELRKFGKNPDNDPDYQRWLRNAAAMKNDRDELLKCRQEVYIEFKKIELANAGGESEKERVAKVKRARELVERVKDALITLRREAGE